MHCLMASHPRSSRAAQTPPTNASRSLARNLVPIIFGACALSGSALAAPLGDAQILGIYIQVNSFDIETALLGRSLAGSDAVRELAEHVAADHLGVRQAAYALAQKCGVAPALPGARDADAVEHGKVMARLASLKGAEFDRAYLQHEAAFHTAAIGAVRSALLPSASCPDLQGHFRGILPAFEHHLSMTEALAAK